MKTKIFKILIIQVIFIISTLTVNMSVNAIYENCYIGDISMAKDFDPGDYKPEAYDKGPTGSNKIKEKGNKIIGVLQFIGSAVSVIALIVIGIKYMLGSVEERAEYKETMKPYIIGAFLVFGITTILGVVNSLTGGLF